MTRIAYRLLTAILAGGMACVPAAHARESKNGSSELKSKCTVAAVVIGTGWDIFGGSSSCSMLNDNDRGKDAVAGNSQRQTALPIKSKK